MKQKQFTQNIGYFILAVLLIIVYKTFDSLGAVFQYIGQFLSLLSPIAGAFVIAFVLYPACKKLEDIYTKIPRISRFKRGAAVATVYLGAFIVVSGFIAILVPVIISSITDFIIKLPSITESVIKYLYSLKFGEYSLKPMLDTITIDNIVSKTNLTDVNVYLNSISSVSKWFVNIGLSIIISIYILLDRASLLKTAHRALFLILPNKSKEIFLKYAYQSFVILYKYIYCQLLDMCVVAVIAFCALMIMDVEYAPILAIFIGVANVVPYFGAVVACALSAILTAFTASFSKGVIVAVVLIVLQQIDSNIIQPKIVKNTLKVKPFWVLCGVLVGGGLFGIAGIILAVPTIALVKIIIEDVLDYKMNSKSGAKAENSKTPSEEKPPVE